MLQVTGGDVTGGDSDGLGWGVREAAARAAVHPVADAMAERAHMSGSPSRPFSQDILSTGRRMNSAGR